MEDVLQQSSTQYKNRGSRVVSAEALMHRVWHGDQPVPTPPKEHKATVQLNCGRTFG